MGGAGGGPNMAFVKIEKIEKNRKKKKTRKPILGAV
jgi:hypothetical protein